VTYCVACVLFGINSFQTDEILFGVIDIVIALIAGAISFFIIAKK